MKGKNGNAKAGRCSLGTVGTDNAPGRAPRAAAPWMTRAPRFMVVITLQLRRQLVTK